MSMKFFFAIVIIEKKNSETRIVNVGRKWIPIRVKMSLTRDALMTLAGSVIMGPILSTLNHLDTSVTGKNA